VEAGIIPESSLQKIEWMYQGGTSQNKGNSAEDFLLGKPVKELNQEGKEKQDPYGKSIVPVIRATYATPENEAFTKMIEDPMVYIMAKE